MFFLPFQGVQKLNFARFLHPPQPPLHLDLLFSTCPPGALRQLLSQSADITFHLPCSNPHFPTFTSHLTLDTYLLTCFPSTNQLTVFIPAIFLQLFATFSRSLCFILLPVFVPDFFQPACCCHLTLK